MKRLSDKIIYTADDEMPDCGQCDNCCNDFECSKLCGAEKGWNGYQRTIYKKDKLKVED